MTMDFFDAVKKRRSIRRYTGEHFPDEYVRRAFEAAVLAPNSSNTQTWDFHWLKNPEMKAKAVRACLNQSAARTCSHLVVITADPKNWKRSQQALIDWVKEAKAPKVVLWYYEKLVPLTYRWGLFNFLAPFKWAFGFFIGFFRPITRGPNTKRDIQEVAIKSAALAAENFVLAIAAQGGATCMMEGFDERRMRKLLRLPCSARVVMAISIGYEAERGTWGPQFRLPLERVLHIHE